MFTIIHSCPNIIIAQILKWIHCHDGLVEYCVENVLYSGSSLKLFSVTTFALDQISVSLGEVGDDAEKEELLSVRIIDSVIFPIL